MKETDEQLAKILSKGLEMATKSGNFIIDQAPDLIQQLIFYKTVENAIQLLIYIIVMYFLGKMIYKDHIKEDEYIDRDPIIQIFGGAVFIFFSISAWFSISDLIKLIFAPKIYLIEYISHLIK